MNDKSLGKEKFTRTYDPGLTTGYGNRPYNWGLGALGPAGNPPARLGGRRLFPQLVEQLVRGRQPGDHGWRDYTPFSIRAPVDPRLPGGGGQVDQRPV